MVSDLPQRAGHALCGIRRLVVRRGISRVRNPPLSKHYDPSVPWMVTLAVLVDSNLWQMALDANGLGLVEPFCPLYGNDQVSLVVGGTYYAEIFNDYLSV